MKAEDGDIIGTGRCHEILFNGYGTGLLWAVQGRELSTIANAGMKYLQRVQLEASHDAEGLKQRKHDIFFLALGWLRNWRLCGSSLGCSLHGALALGMDGAFGVESVCKGVVSDDESEDW